MAYMAHHPNMAGFLPRAMPGVRSTQRGFNLVELAVALAGLGVLTWLVAGAYGNADNQRKQDAARAHGKQMLEAVRAFALSNARLPCPDTDGDGWEGAGGVCPAGTETGWLPYRSLGMDLPDDRLRAQYGVYRNAAATAGNADLAVRTERSIPADVAGDMNYKNVGDLIIGLNNAAAEAPVATHIHLTGDNATLGNINCANNIVGHPAAVLVIPLDDRGGNGNRYDGVHANFGANLCAQGPDTPATSVQDDVVVADTLPALAGWLAARAP